jgi:hypothetical protein
MRSPPRVNEGVLTHKTYFVVVPTAHFVRCGDLLSAVNSGKPVFLMDTAFHSPQSFMIRPKRGGARTLRVGEELLVTNESRLWLVRIRRLRNGYVARREGNFASGGEPPKE